MRIAGKPLLFSLLAVPLAAATIWAGQAGNDDVVTIASWNLEWLVSPQTSHAGRLACRSGRRSSLPCDVAEDLARDSADLARLAAYARRLDADVVAFQEVENEAIARRIFSGYAICMADGSGAQHVGFAVRPQLNHRCGPVVEDLSVEGRSRKAMSMQLQPARGPALELLVVHLKSGCSRDPLDSPSAACRLLAQQAERLGAWIAARSAQRAPFIVLGDFNRVPPATDEDPFWQQVQTGPTELLATRLPFSNCFAGQPYTAFIDHMLWSIDLRDRILEGSPRHTRYCEGDPVRYHLSDHCPVSISLNFGSDSRPSGALSPVGC